jgi:hypothetical protein
MLANFAFAVGLYNLNCAYNFDKIIGADL